LQLNLLVLSYPASTAVVVGVALAAWRRRRLVGAGGLALLMLAVGWWLLANALEASAVDRSMKIAWSVVAYPGIESAPVLYLLFVLAWTRQDGWLTRGRVALLLLVPTISVGIAATNEWHHLSSHRVSRGRQRLPRRLGGSTCGSARSRTRGGAMPGCSWSCAR
jgi:hypothetical protein